MAETKTYSLRFTLDNGQVVNAGSFVVPPGETGPQGPQGIQGIQGPQGEQGKPFKIEKIYNSVSAMNAGASTDGVLENGLVLIETGDVNDEDNAKLYVKENGVYVYLTDLSGAQGVQGPQGIPGLNVIGATITEIN